MTARHGSPFFPKSKKNCASFPNGGIKNTRPQRSMLKDVRSIYFPDRIQKFSEIVEISRGSEFELVGRKVSCSLYAVTIGQMVWELLVILI